MPTLSTCGLAKNVHALDEQSKADVPPLAYFRGFISIFTLTFTENLSEWFVVKDTYKVLFNNNRGYIHAKCITGNLESSWKK